MSKSATLAINEIVAAKRRDGESVLHLGFGECGLPVLPELRQELGKHAGAASYGPVAGIDALRESAAGYWARRRLPTSPEDVVAGPGSKALLFAVIEAIDGALALPVPSWVSYAAQAAILHRRVFPVAIDPALGGGIPDPVRFADALRSAASAGTPIRGLVVTVPDNPTGTIAHDDALREVLGLARTHGVVVVADEIYRDLVHDPERRFLSPAEIAPERVIVTSGLSKNLALGGWRIGLARFPHEHPQLRAIGERVLSVASEIWTSPSQPVQHAAAWALREPTVVRERIADSCRLHGVVANAVCDAFASAGACVTRPEAAFYLYPDFSGLRDELTARWNVESSPDLAYLLLTRFNVAVLPGVAFGDDAARMTLRVATSLLYGADDAERLHALHFKQPLALHWISEQVAALQKALTQLIEGP